MTSAAATVSVEVSGRRLHVREAGAGPAVLLIHGIPTCGDLWRDVIPPLAERARVVVPDLLGYGRSDLPAGEPLDLPAHADRLVRLMDAMGVSRATVVGHDIGGGIAQILATRHPQRVERLGLIDCVAYDNWPVPEMRAMRVAAPVLGHTPAALTTAAIEQGLRRGFMHQERAEAFLETFLEPFSTSEGRDVLLEHVRALDNRSTREIAPLLPGIQVPASVIWGRHDPFLETRWAERLAGDIPTAELTWIDAGHFTPADAPDPVARALERLLDR